jgi:hypothetical protein
MAEFNYDMFSLGTRAKEKLKEVSQEGATSAGIGAKPADEQEPMDKGFYESMYEAITTYFDNAEEADRVLTAKEIDKDRTKEEVLREFDALDSLLSEDRETPMLDAYQAEDIDARMTEFDAQVGRYRDAIPAQIYTMESRAEQGNGLKDVTDTEEGKLSNEEPLYEMAEEIDPGTIEIKGLMSKPDDDSADGVQPTRGKELLDFIGEGEGTYDSANRGTINGKIQGAETSAKRDGKLVSEMTVSEIRKYQAITDPKDKNRLFTVGKYQTTPDTFEEAVKALGISEDTVFSSDVQDKVGIYLVSKKRPRLGRYLKGDDSVSTDRAMLALAMEFASVPVPYSIKKGTYGSWPKVDLVAGDTFYKDKAKGGNKALHTVDETRDMLKATFGVLK